MVVRFLVVGFGLLMIFLVGSDVVGLWVFFFFGSCGRRWWWDLMFVWLVLGFGVFFFSLGFLAGGGFQWWWWWFPVWCGFAVEDAMVFWICSGGC